MSTNLENTSLVLNTRDAVASDNKATHTWNNINLESLLEGMYDKYDSFNLCLSFAMSMTNAVSSYGAGTTVNDSKINAKTKGMMAKIPKDLNMVVLPLFNLSLTNSNTKIPIPTKILKINVNIINL